MLKLILLLYKQECLSLCEPGPHQHAFAFSQVGWRQCGDGDTQKHAYEKSQGLLPTEKTPWGSWTPHPAGRASSDLPSPAQTPPQPKQ